VTITSKSLDSRAWTEIDRQTDTNAFFCGGSVTSFAISEPAECRFIRFTQTGERHSGDDYLNLQILEFFGALSE
jgi:hypothetical protein